MVFKHLVSQSYVVRTLRGPSVSSKVERIYLQRKGEGEGKGREEKRREEKRREEKRREEKRRGEERREETRQDTFAVQSGETE